MDIICASCGRHFNSIEGIKEHSKYCKSRQEREFHLLHSKENAETSTSKQKGQFEVIFPPPIPIPKRARMDKPFLGAFRTKELKNDDNRYCGLCHNKGLVSHAIVKKKYTFIDAYWCPNCKMVLWVNNTYKH